MHHVLSGNTLGKKHAARDHATSANHRITAQNGGARIHSHMIFQCWMPLVIFAYAAVLVLLKTFRAQSHALINLATLSNHGGLPNDNASTVINK